MSTNVREEKVQRLRLLREQSKRKIFSIKHLSEKQLEIIKADNTYLLIEGGNGASKTFTATKKFQLALYNPNPFVKYDFTAKKAWVLSVTRETCHNVLWLEKLKPMIPPEDIVKIEKDGRFISRVYLKNGWTIDFMSYMRGREAIQAASVDLVLIDELPPYDVFKEVQQRMRHKDRCRMILAFTPLEDDPDMKKWCQTTPGPIGEENEANYTNRFRLTKYDNPTLKFDLIETERRNMSEEEWQVRGLGMWATKGNVVFGDAFNGLNIVQPFEIQSHWRRVLAVDPATSSFCGAVWLAEDPDTQEWVAYREGLLTGLAPSQLVLEIKKLTAGEKLWDVIPDPHESWFIKEYMEIDPNQPMSLPAKANNKENFIASLKEELVYKRIKVFNTLENLIQQIRLYRRDLNGKIVKKNDHLVDCMLYFNACKPIPRRVSPTLTSFSQRLWNSFNKKNKSSTNSDPYGKMF